MYVDDLNWLFERLASGIKYAFTCLSVSYSKRNNIIRCYVKLTPVDFTLAKQGISARDKLPANKAKCLRIKIKAPLLLVCNKVTQSKLT